MENQIKSSSRWRRFVLFIALPVVGFGLYHSYKVLSNRKNLIENGKFSFATIKTISKGKCGLGYGYSATFTYEVNDRILTGECECESRSWVQPGDLYLVAYDSVQPDKVHLFADSLIASSSAILPALGYPECPLSCSKVGSAKWQW
jgi:hypothetical protein